MIQADVDVEAVFAAAMALAERGPEEKAAANALGIKMQAGPVDVEAMARQIEIALAGAPETIRACRRLIKGQHPHGYLCSDVSHAVLRQLRVSPEIVAAIAIMSVDLETDPIHFEVVDAQGRRHGIRVEGQNDGMRVEVDLAPDMQVVWSSPTITMMDALPQTVMLAIQGLWLSEVLTHPAIDLLPLKVESARSDKAGRTILTVSGNTMVDVLEQVQESAEV